MKVRESSETRTHSVAVDALLCTDIDHEEAEFEARAEARIPQLKHLEELETQLACLRLNLEKAEATAQCSKLRLQWTRLGTQQKLLGPAIAKAERSRLELQKRLLAAPALVAAASAAPSSVAAAAASSSSAAAAVSNSRMPGQLRSQVASSVPRQLGSSSSKRKERDDDDADIASSQSDVDSSHSSDDEGHARKKKRKKSKKKHKERHHMRASPKVKMEPGLMGGANGSSQLPAAAAASSSRTRSVDRSPVAGDFGSDQDLIDWIHPPKPTAARAADAPKASAGHATRAKKHGKKRS